MCRMICESNCDNAKTARILSDIPNRTFHDFSLYFGRLENEQNTSEILG